MLARTSVWNYLSPLHNIFKGKSMKKLAFITGLSLLLLTGCAKKTTESAMTPAAADPVQVTAPAVEPQPAPPVQTVKTQDQRLQECRKELDAMRVYNKASYNKYQAEFLKLTASNNKYLRIKESISTEINDVVMPQTEFQTRELCFRIKSRLVQLMIRS
jgi:hypothetical protein